MQKTSKIMKYKILSVTIGLVVLFLLCLSFFIEKKEQTFNNKEVVKKTSFVIIPNGLGVNTHFVGKQIDIDMIRDAGFSIIRTDLFWSVIEKKRGFMTLKIPDMTL